MSYSRPYEPRAVEGKGTVAQPEILQAHGDSDLHILRIVETVLSIHEYRISSSTSSRAYVPTPTRNRTLIMTFLPNFARYRNESKRNSESPIFKKWNLHTVSSQQISPLSAHLIPLLPPQPPFRPGCRRTLARYRYGGSPHVRLRVRSA